MDRPVLRGHHGFLNVYGGSHDDNLAACGTPVPDTLGETAKAALRMTHKSILALSADIENFRFNRAVAFIADQHYKRYQKDEAGASAAKRCY